MTAGLGRTLTYTSYNMPSQVVGVGYAGGASTTYNYVYNAEHERTKLVHSTLGTFIYLHPAGKGQLLYEKQTEASPSTRIEHKYYISAGGMSVAVHYARENPNQTETTTETRYLHQDHLGSITLITNEAGGVTERLAYEAYGKRRYPAGTDDPTNGLFGQVTDRGFTSHEHLDEIALIHMNGRVYDPVLGRFVTADPFLQDPGNLQSYNRYSYVLNNPLMYTDPTGYFSLKKVFKAVAVVAIAYFTYGLVESALINSATTGFVAGANGLSTALVTLGGEAGVLTGLGSAIAGAASGFAVGFVASGGNFEAGLSAAVAGGLTLGVTTSFANSSWYAQALARGTVGGVSSKIQGGDFGVGFKYAAFSSVVNSGIEHYTGEASNAQTSRGDSHVKPDFELMNSDDRFRGFQGVIDPYGPNAGTAAVTNDPTLVGRLTSTLTEKDSVRGLGLFSENGPILGPLNRYVPGIRALGVFHDKFVFQSLPSLVGTGRLYEVLNVSTIPPLLLIQYEGLGARELSYSIKNSRKNKK
ncbi:MAG: RHS repeat-associated core domain-containing protein [Burkholderiales bacterium]